MRIYQLKQAVYEITVTDDLKPSVADEYRDRKGHRWRVRSVGEYRGIELSDPPAPKPLWVVTVTAEHYAYRLEPGEELVGIDTKRFSPDDDGQSWEGAVVGAPGDRKGFGRIHRADGGDDTWIYRESATSFQFCVGPWVKGFNDFKEPRFQRRWPADERDAWVRIVGVLNGLRSGLLNPEVIEP